MSSPEISIKFAAAPSSGTAELLAGEISGASVISHGLRCGELITLPSDERAVPIILICRGHAEINGISCDGRGVLAFSPGTEINVRVVSDCVIIEIRYVINEGESLSPGKLPYFVRYGEAVRYREDCKSEKTVSRMLLSEGIIPGIALGSVETYGKDAVEPHRHPYCDQLFFSFEENDMEVLIDGSRVHMGGNMLLHIPLGSTHGVDVREGGCAHYVWIDFIIDERGIEYMNSAHEKI